jgi:hypothetical protein
MLRKIISDCQTGADRAGLDIAIERSRQAWNIMESDGTVIFSLERLLSGGTKLTWGRANKRLMRRRASRVEEGRVVEWGTGNLNFLVTCYFRLARLSLLEGFTTRESAPNGHRDQKVCTTGAMFYF